MIKLGIIGTDSSHSVAFTRIFHDAAATDRVPEAQVVCAYPGGSPDLPMSRSRVDGFAAELRDQCGVVLVSSIAAVIDQCDGALLLSVDGRAHLDQARPILEAGRPVFIDKPLAGNLRSGLALQALAQATGTPVFSASSLRFCSGVQSLRQRDVGPRRGATASGPLLVEPTMPDWYYYGIHATEALYTVLGPGCHSLSCSTLGQIESVTGQWTGDRTGTVQGHRTGSVPFAITVFGERATATEPAGAAYAELCQQIGAFFRTGRSPVELSTTVEILTFLEAVDESKRRGGSSVTLEEVLARARTET